ncbi:uncharacterized protein LOC132709539 [Pantherophis guttatus]|uniref:Uncharacterized protein LOC132709539 n=1 Tax=Pantherophis guttatus TaxID=94885 RepID=A0ABM3YTQ4_PANGU|nr:uncharacterized protein LOC132709539 [Pantherophis guttatus]XP_060539506.1 uncharacterized protein LOC132709539 [Pantherophis guttatus]XP_060539507.1 uncharacterized protein LOC132709539 [Pantherophis guttatus]XP_060539508.1 uncharacterized protein LOC132709539 [Pantherophis guttatus]
MKKSGKQSQGKPSALDSQPGTSKDASKKMRQAPLSKDTSKVSLVSQSKMTSFSKELFNTWRDIRWFQIPLSSLRKPKAGLFSFTFQSSLQRYQQLRKTKRLKVGRPFSVLPFPSLSLPFTDPPAFRDALRDDNHRSSKTDGSKVRKRLSAHRNDSRSFLRRMQKKFQKHQPSPDVLPPKCVPSAAVSGQKWVPGSAGAPERNPRRETLLPQPRPREEGKAPVNGATPSLPWKRMRTSSHQTGHLHPFSSRKSRRLLSARILGLALNLEALRKCRTASKRLSPQRNRSRKSLFLQPRPRKETTPSLP